MASMGPFQSTIYGDPNLGALFQMLREKSYVQFTELDQVIFHSKFASQPYVPQPRNASVLTQFEFWQNGALLYYGE